MPRRRLLIGLTAAGAVSAGFGAAVLPANAEQRAVTVTLLGGKTITVTLDVPAGTPLDQITLPKISTPIIGIADRGAPVAPSEPVPTVPAQPVARQATKRAHRQMIAKGRALVPENIEPAAKPTATRFHRAPAPVMPRRRRTRRSRSRCRARRRSACRISSSTSSGSRRSCCRSTRPRGSSTGCAGRCWRRSTRSRPTTGATSTSRRRVRWAGCSSCRRPGSATGPTPTAIIAAIRTTRSTRSSPPPAT